MTLNCVCKVTIFSIEIKRTYRSELVFPGLSFETRHWLRLQVSGKNKKNKNDFLRSNILESKLDGHHLGETTWAV